MGILSVDISLSLVPCCIKEEETCFFKEMKKEFLDVGSIDHRLVKALAFLRKN